MPSLKSGLRIFPRQAGYRDVNPPSPPPPEPLPLPQAAAADSVTAGLASLPQDLREQSSRHVVMLRGRRSLFLLENGTLRNAFPVAIGMPGWENPPVALRCWRRFPIRFGCIR